MNIDIEYIIFNFCSYVKRFHQHLIEKYQLADIPYNLKGKAFPKMGLEDVNGVDVKYQFHGRGCTLNWNGNEVNYDIDASSVHDIMISIYPVSRFIQTSPQFRELPYANYSSEEIYSVLQLLESRGVLMTRKLSDLGSFHVNNVWYESFRDGKEFNGDNKDEIDWI
jgi:hypothetical protein